MNSHSNVVIVPNCHFHFVMWGEEALIGMSRERFEVL